MCIPAGRSQGPGHPPEHPSGANLSTHTWGSPFLGRIHPPTAPLCRILPPAAEAAAGNPGATHGPLRLR